MIYSRLTLSLLASLFCVFFSDAQDLNKISRIAEETFYEEDFENALELYELLIKSSEEPDPDFLYKAEICSLLSKYPNNPLDKFLSYEETQGATDKFYNYWKGRILLRKYKMIEANEAFIKFLNTEAFLSKEIKDEVKVWKEWLADTKRVLDNPFSYEIHHLEDRINTQFAELSPVYFEEKDELLFVSNRDESNPDVYQIYHSIHRGDKNWTDPKPIDGLGTFKRENSNIEVVAEDGRLFQFRKKKKGDLFYSNPVLGTLDWTEPVEFDSKVTSTHLSSHFFINEHEDRVIFASNIGTRKRQNLDLFETFRNVETGKWSKPRPFAFSINSDFNEDSPYLSPDEKTLYFASNGHGSVGGYDIYMTSFDEENQAWSEPVNMGFPINTPDDEIHFKLNTDQTSGYFTSNRLNTNGDYDIFFFWEIHKIKMEGRVVDLETNEPLNDAQIFFRPYEYLDMYFFSEVDSTGKFSAMINSDDIFRVEIIKSGVPIHQEDFEIHATGGEETTYIKNFYIGEKKEDTIVSTVETSETETSEEEISEDVQLSRLGNKFRNTNTAVLQNIYFDFGTSQLTDESIPTLNAIKALLEKEPSMQIEIGGHTDNVGGDEVNIEIGMKRAETVLKWLTKNGISKKRLTAKSYGSTRPLASNDDEREGRELNRRIEIVVIE